MIYLKQNHDTEKLNIYDLSDMHVGSLAFHEKAFIKIRDKIKRDKSALVKFNGDATEGKTIDSPHFNPEGLKPGKLNIHNQCDYFVELWKPIANKTILFGEGNHDMYLSKDFDVTGYMAKELGISEVRGGYQTLLDINEGELVLHNWHGRPTMPRGAKDPIQREANQKAWLKRVFEGLASAHAHYMGHTHKCLITPPTEKYALLRSGENVKGRFFTEQEYKIDGEQWIPPDARWYVNTGTFRRTGMFGYTDYSEIAGYAPVPIACTKTEVRNGKIADIKKIIL